MAGLILSNRNNGKYRDPFALLARDFFSWEPPVRAWEPRFNVYETAEAYVAEADLPGVADEDVEVTLDGGVLTISGKRDKRDEREGDVVHIVERSSGTFTRKFSLPETIDKDKIGAILKAGVLTVTIPKLPLVLPRKIPVAVTQ